MKYIFSIILLLSITAADLKAHTYIDSLKGQGDILSSYGAASLGRGHTSIAISKGAEALPINPSRILDLRYPEVIMAVSVYPVKENIEDSEDNIYVNSANYYSISDISAVYPFSKTFAVGIGRFPVHDFNYNIDRNTYSSGILSNYDSAESKGFLYANSLAAAVLVFDRLNLGLSYNMLNADVETDIIDTDVGVSKSNYEKNVSGQSSFLNLGMNYNIKDGFDLSFFWRPAFDIELDVDELNASYSWSNLSATWATASTALTSTRELRKYPDTYGIGLSYEFWERDRAILSIDYTVMDTSAYRYKTAAPGQPLGDWLNPRYEDTESLKIGVTHYLKRTLKLRYGFAHFPGYYDSSLDLAVITAGVGIDVSNSLNLDIGAAYGKRSYLADLAGFSEADEYVDERIAELRISATWSYINKKGIEKDYNSAKQPAAELPEEEQSLEDYNFEQEVMSPEPGINTSASSSPEDEIADAYAEYEDMMEEKRTEAQTAPRQDRDESKLVISCEKLFDGESSDLSGSAKKELKNALRLIKENPETLVYIDVYSDSMGAASFKKQLTEQRAETLYDFFIKKRIPRKRLSYKGHGANNPIDSNDTEEGRKRNSRVEIYLQYE